MGVRGRLEREGMCVYLQLIHIVLPVVVYGCESWTVKKAEHQRMDAFELWCWRSNNFFFKLGFLLKSLRVLVFWVPVLGLVLGRFLSH